MMIDIGFGNFIAAERVVAVTSPDSAPIKRLVQDAKDAGIAVDVTCGKKTLSVLLTDSGHVVLSSLETETVKERLEEKKKGSHDET